MQSGIPRFLNHNSYFDFNESVGGCEIRLRENWQFGTGKPRLQLRRELARAEDYRAEPITKIVRTNLDGNIQRGSECYSLDEILM